MQSLTNEAVYANKQMLFEFLIERLKTRKAMSEKTLLLCVTFQTLRGTRKIKIKTFDNTHAALFQKQEYFKAMKEMLLIQKQFCQKL